jgi:hypothetical protein
VIPYSENPKEHLMAVVRADDQDTGTCFVSLCARCGKSTHKSKALVYWWGIESTVGVGSIVLHAGCALTWAAHLTADAVDARNASRDAK